MPAFWLSGPLVYFAAFQRHVGFYPAGSGIDEFKESLATYKSGKGSIQFPFDRPLPLELIAEITALRVAENMRRAEEKVRSKRPRTIS